MAWLVVVVALVGSGCGGSTSSSDVEVTGSAPSASDGDSEQPSRRGPAGGLPLAEGTLSTVELSDFPAHTGRARVAGDGGPSGIGACRELNPEYPAEVIEVEPEIGSFLRGLLAWVEIQPADLRSQELAHQLTAMGEALVGSTDALVLEPFAVGLALPDGLPLWFDAIQLQDLDDLESVAAGQVRVLVGFEIADGSTFAYSQYLAVVRGDDVWFAGHCSHRGVTEPINDYAASTGRTPGDTLLALIADETERAALREFLYPPRLSPQEQWLATDPRERSVGFGDEPQEVTDQLLGAVLGVAFPDAWKDIDDAVFCAWTNAGWNGCLDPSIELGGGQAGEPVPYVVWVDPNGVLELWLQTDDFGKTAGIKLGEIDGSQLGAEWTRREDELGGGIPPLEVRITDDATTFEAIMQTATTSPPTLAIEPPLELRTPDGSS